MPAPTTDAVVRVKALRSIAQLFTSRETDQQVFDLVLRNIYSNVWVMIDPGTFCYKIQDTTPKAQIISLIEKLGKTRLAVVFRARNEDMTRYVYLVKLNPRMMSKMCRRKTCKYFMRHMSKDARSIVGEEVLIDNDKVNSEWISKIEFQNVQDGDTNMIHYAKFRHFDWERIL